MEVCSFFFSFFYKFQWLSSGGSMSCVAVHGGCHLQQVDPRLSSHPGHIHDLLYEQPHLPPDLWCALCKSVLLRTSLIYVIPINAHIIIHV